MKPPTMKEIEAELAKPMAYMPTVADALTSAFDDWSFRRQVIEASGDEQTVTVAVSLRQTFKMAVAKEHLKRLMALEAEGRRT